MTFRILLSILIEIFVLFKQQAAGLIQHAWRTFLQVVAYCILYLYFFFLILQPFISVIQGTWSKFISQLRDFQRREVMNENKNNDKRDKVVFHTQFSVLTE